MPGYTSGVIREQATELTFWTLFGGGDGEAFQNMTDAFNDEHGDITIDVQRVPWEEYYDRLFTSMTGGDPPDLGIYHTSRLLRYADTLVPLGDRIDFDDYVDSVREMTTVDGTAVAAPLDIHPTTTYYNKDIYEEAGFDPESPPSNWDEFKAVNDAIVDAGYTAYDPGTGRHGLRVWIPWLRSAGHELLTEDNEPNFNNDAGLEITEVWSNLVDWGWCDAESEQSFERFPEGDHGALNEGTWAYSRFKEGGGEELESDWGIYHQGQVAPGADEEAYVWANSHTIGIPQKDRSDSELEAAVTAAEWLTKDAGVTWSAEAGHLSASTEALESDELREEPVWDKTLHLFYELATEEQVYYNPRTERNAEYHEALFNNVDAVRFGEKEPQAALDDAEQRIEQIFQA